MVFHNGQMTRRRAQWRWPWPASAVWQRIAPGLATGGNEGPSTDVAEHGHIAFRSRHRFQDRLLGLSILPVWGAHAVQTDHPVVDRVEHRGLDGSEQCPERRRSWTDGACLHGPETLQQEQFTRLRKIFDID